MLSGDAPNPQPVIDRFLVKKLGREFLVKVSDIDWIESAGNYITLHVGDIRVHDTGDGELRLRSGARVPVSRRYRAVLRDRLL